ncbi:MAG: glycosyltransferase [Acidobacteriota bacterium]
MRVLMSAYQCGPGMGSVSQIGWEWYRRMRERASVTLVTHERNREALEAAGADGDVMFIDTEWFAGPLYGFASKLFPRSQHSVFLVSSLDYFVFDAAAVRAVRKRQRAGDRWDVVHAPTPVSSLASTRLFRSGLPVVLGPLNSGVEEPRGFPEIMKADSGWTSRFRAPAAWIGALRGTLARSALILSATRATDRTLPTSCRDKVRRVLENGVETDRFRPSEREEASQARPLRITFVGRLVPFKGVGMLLDAVGRLVRRREVEVRIVGDGPMMEEWRSAADSLQIAERVHFLGNVALDEVSQHMAWCDVFCLPSVRESGGAVLLEAMAMERPVIALGHGGPGELVDDEVGRLLPAESHEQVVTDLERTFDEICGAPGDWAEKGLRGAVRVAERYSWDAKVSEVLGMLEELAVEGASLQTRRSDRDLLLPTDR